MLVTLFGITMLLSFAFLSNALFEIETTNSGIIALVAFVFLRPVTLKAPFEL